MMPQLTGAKRLSCNNIRPNTIPFYEFLGYTGARMDHFYRLAPRAEYKVARITDPTILPAGGDGVLVPFLILPRCNSSLFLLKMLVPARICGISNGGIFAIPGCNILFSAD